MSTDHDALENLLRDALKQVGDGAPRGPQPQAILQRIAARRRRQRWISGAIAAAAAVLVAALTWLNLTGQREPLRSDSAAPAVVSRIPESVEPEPTPTSSHRAQATLAAVLETASSANAADMDWSTSLNLHFAATESEWTFYNLGLAMSDGG